MTNEICRSSLAFPLVTAACLAARPGELSLSSFGAVVVAGLESDCSLTRLTRGCRYIARQAAVFKLSW
jgi:hypothetical protein